MRRILNYKNKSLLFILVLLLQIFILAVMVLNSHLIILWGEKITLQVEPIDPRSLFQGDYVWLNYSINRIDLKEVNHDFDPEQIRKGDPVYLTLVPQGGTWVPELVTQDLSKIKNKLYLKGKIEYISYDFPAPIEKKELIEEPPTPTLLNIKWGIEQYYVPEGKGKEIEDRIREGEVYAQISVYKGRARVINLINSPAGQ